MLWIRTRHVRRDIQRLRRDYRKVMRLLELPDRELHFTAPTVSKWSIVQHLDHILLVNGSVLRNIGRILGETGENVENTGRPSWLGVLVLVSGRIPRGKGRAPDAVIPPSQPQRGEVRTSTEKSKQQLDALRSQANALGRQRGRIRHFVFGELNAAQWLRFASIHTRHHLRIIRDVLRQMANADHNERVLRKR